MTPKMTNSKAMAAGWLSGVGLFLALAWNAGAAERGLAVTYTAPPGGRGGLKGTVKVYDKSVAVVIGIDQYRSANIPALGGAVRDAKLVAAELRNQGFTVTTLINDQATGRAIKELLGDLLPNRIGREDRVLVYYAGHGTSTGKGEDALGYLIPTDGDRDRIRSTGVSMRELADWFDGYPSKHVMFVADACYSGLALSTRSVGLSTAISDYLLQITKKPVRMILTAGGSGQVAHEWRGQGLFTRFFISAITGSADTDHDGIVTSDEVAAYVKPNVAQTARSRLHADQTPLVGRDGEGEFVFVVGKPSVSAASRVAVPEPPAEPAEPAAAAAEEPAPAQWEETPGAMPIFAGGKKLFLAVADLSADNIPPGEAAVVAGLLRGQLAGAGAFGVVEKRNMDMILAEQAFQQTGCTSLECGVKLGRLLNVRVMVIGSLGKLLGSYLLSVRVVEVETGRIMLASQAHFESADEIESGTKVLAARIAALVR